MQDGTDIAVITEQNITSKLCQTILFWKMKGENMKRKKSKATATKKVSDKDQKWILLDKINVLLLDVMKSSQTAQHI